MLTRVKSNSEFWKVTWPQLEAKGWFTSQNERGRQIYVPPKGMYDDGDAGSTELRTPKQVLNFVASHQVRDSSDESGTVTSGTDRDADDESEYEDKVSVPKPTSRESRSGSMLATPAILPKTSPPQIETLLNLDGDLKAEPKGELTPTTLGPAKKRRKMEPGKTSRSSARGPTKSAKSAADENSPTTMVSPTTGKLTFVCNRCGRTEFKNGHALGGHKKYCLKKQYEHSSRNRLALGLSPLPSPELKVWKSKMKKVKTAKKVKKVKKVSSKKGRKNRKLVVKIKPLGSDGTKAHTEGRSLLKRRREEPNEGESKSSLFGFSDDYTRIPDVDMGSSIEWRNINISSQGFPNPSPSPRDFDLLAKDLREWYGSSAELRTPMSVFDYDTPFSIGMPIKPSVQSIANQLDWASRSCSLEQLQEIQSLLNSEHSRIASIVSAMEMESL